MKVLSFKISKPTTHKAIIYQEDKGIAFYDKLHQHEEIQLCTIISGEGTLIVGDTIHEYTTGDILIIGSYLPHVFKSDTSNCNTSFMISLFFTKSSFGENFFSLGDLAEIRSLFEISTIGAKVLTKKDKITMLFLALKQQSDFKRFITFFEIVHEILNADIVPLSTFMNPKKYSDNEGKRMSAIMNYTMNNFQEEITLKEIAEISNMTPTAFCRYFKQRTDKTYFQFLIEIRIENACRLLKNKELLITEVSEKSGFKNNANFNRKFKQIKECTPSKYRKENS